MKILKLHKKLTTPFQDFQIYRDAIYGKLFHHSVELNFCRQRWIRNMMTVFSRHLLRVISYWLILIDMLIYWMISVDWLIDIDITDELNLYMFLEERKSKRIDFVNSKRDYNFVKILETLVPSFWNVIGL